MEDGPLGMTMRACAGAVLGVVVLSSACGAAAQERRDRKDEKVVVQGTPEAPAAGVPADSMTEGTVHVGGEAIGYRAVAGILTVGSTDSYDAMLGLDGKQLPDSGMRAPDKDKPEEAPAVARMFYTAYFKKAAAGESRPVTFLYNGGPGSATMYLHMGSFGPKRVMTTDGQHDEGAPYRIVDNQYSLLDVSDLVFIDAPGTGFSRVVGKDAAKDFYGVDGDVGAFDRFIRRFLTKYNRWNSPKFLFGESYGTPRSAALSAALENVDLNGVILLSQILSYNDSPDGAGSQPGMEQGFFLALPSFAATAWYHHRVPNQPAELEPFLKEVEQYSLGEYASALLMGADLPEARKEAVAEKLHSYTGVPAAYWVKANLRVAGGEFSKELQTEIGVTTGRLDSRYEGPAIDPINSEAEYDPFTQSIDSAYTTAINSYVRTDLKFGEQMTYKPSAREPGWHWNMEHHGPLGGRSGGPLNVMGDLATTMKLNPKMKVLLMGGYFDLGTLYFGATYEMKHLPMPVNLQNNISYHFFHTGHMVYVNEDALRGLHETTAAFIKANEGGR